MTFKQTITWSGNDAQVDSDGRLLTSISGNIVIGSVSANVDSVYIQSGANMDLGSAWTNIGSITGTVDATIVTSPVPVSGAVVLYATASGTGTITPVICNPEGALYTISGTI